MITETQRQNRRKYLGSSDAAAIVGVDPWKTSADVFWDKINPTSEAEDQRQLSDAMIIGTMCEDAVLNWFAKETGKKIIKNQRRVHENKIMAANFDALVVGEDEAVEAKTTGIIYQFDKDKWGEVETDEVPDQIIIQCQHQMSILPEIRVVWVPVLLGGVGFRKYKIERNEDIIKHLEEMEVRFWTEHVEKRLPPPDSVPNMETLKKIRREPKKTVLVDDSIVGTWLEAKERKKIAEEAEEEAKRALLSSLGDAEAAECSLGVLTYYEQTRESYVVKDATFRVPRFKKNKLENEAA